MKDTTLPEYVQTEDPSFIRNTYSKALLNTDRSALERHRRHLTKAHEQQQVLSEVVLLAQRTQQMEERLDILSNQLDRILQLLAK